MMSQQTQSFSHSQMFSGKHSFLSLALLPHHTHLLLPPLPLNRLNLEGKSGSKCVKVLCHHPLPLKEEA